MPLSFRFGLKNKRRWWVIPAIAAAVAGSQFYASADEQVASRRRRAYCPPTQPCPPQQVMPYAPPTKPAPHPTPVKPTEPKPMDPKSTDTKPTDPQTPMPSTNNNNTNNNTNTQTDPMDLRNQPAPEQQAPQTQTALASAADAQSAAPNIIGDFFGATFAGNNSFLPVPITNITNFPGVGGSVSSFTGANGEHYGYANGDLISITSPDQVITGLVRVDEYGVPIPGSPTVNITHVNGIAQASDESQVFGPQTPNITVGTVKFTESVSILPRDRVLFNYSYFQQTPLTSDGLGVNRMVPGVEKTFLNGMTSVEIRAPFATTLTNNISLTGSNSRNDLEMGDISLFFKALIAQGDNLAIAGGLGVVTPTSSDLGFFTTPVNPDGSRGDPVRIVQIDHKSFRVAPFVGALWTPSEELFLQGVLQVDTPITGDTVRYSPSVAGGANLYEVGRINNPTFLYLSGSAGYWVYRDPYAEYFGISGFAPIAELHINQSLTKEDSVTGNINDVPFTVGGNRDNITNINATIGGVTQLGPNTSLYVGYATPLGNGVDKSFDGELRVLFNWRFGAGGFRNVPVFQ